MNIRDRFREWLAQNAQGEGLAGFGLGFADKTCFCTSLSESMEMSAMETAMRCLADTFDVAGLHHVSSLEQKWVFEKTLIFCARRPDKIFLAIYAENHEETDLARVRELIELFKTFQPAEGLEP